MNQVTTEQQNAGTIVEDLLARGDLSKMTPEQRARHYVRLCESTGLNPLTQPFRYMTLQGQLQLYTTKTATDQLRAIHGISIAVVDRVVFEGVLTVTVKATNDKGRIDEDSGSVSLIGLKGEALANAQMKALTKAKRRATLSICGLGYLDESELETVPGVEMVPDLPPAIEPTGEPTPQVAHEEPYRLLVPDDVEWRAWGNGFMAYVRASHSAAEVDRWCQYNEIALKRMQEAEPKMHWLLDAAIAQERKKRAEPAS